MPGQPLWEPLPEDADQAFTRYEGKAMGAVRKVVPRCKEAGARVLCGGRPVDGPGFFYEPTVFAGAVAGMRIVREEAEISRAFEEAGFGEFDRVRVPDVFYAGLMQYDGDALIPKHFLVEPPAIDCTATFTRTFPAAGSGVGRILTASRAAPWLTDHASSSMTRPVES